jgi:hypothetical protein
MAISGRGGMGGMNGGMGGGTFWQQQRSMRYLQDGKPRIRQTLGRIWSALHPYRWQITLGTILMILGVAMTLVPAPFRSTIFGWPCFLELAFFSCQPEALF